MKKSIIFALLLSLLSVQQIHAQKWLKKLGKVAENVLAMTRRLPARRLALSLGVQ